MFHGHDGGDEESLVAQLGDDDHGDGGDESVDERLAYGQTLEIETILDEKP